MKTFTFNPGIVDKVARFMLYPVFFQALTPLTFKLYDMKSWKSPENLPRLIHNSNISGGIPDCVREVIN